MANKCWGYHLILNLSDCDLESMKNKEHIQECVNEILEKTDMHPMGPTIFEYAEFTEDHIDVAGYTVVQVIITSCLVMHLADNSRGIYFDFFSCKPYDKEVVKNIMNKYFKSSSMSELYLTRNA
jgi:S-adenosylmethionine/arginine decarboxylase-like enzyme